jgi:GGDEF domain-containing protein
VRAALRKEDMLVRFGGEEFLVLLPDVPARRGRGRRPHRRAVAAAQIEAAGQRFASP